MFLAAPRSIQERSWERLSSRLECGWLFWGVQLALAPATDPAALSQPPGEVSCLKIPWDEVGGYRHSHVAATPCWAVQWAAGYTIHGATPGRNPSLCSPGRFGEAEENFIWHSPQGWWTTKPSALAKRRNRLRYPTSWQMAGRAYAHISHVPNFNCLDGTAQAQQHPLTRASKCLFQDCFLP